MTDPLIELALRVQLSGVPPAYGSWLLTPRPPLHEGEKQPCNSEYSLQRGEEGAPRPTPRNLSLVFSTQKHQPGNFEGFYVLPQGDKIFGGSSVEPRSAVCIDHWLRYCNHLDTLLSTNTNEYVSK